ncbi:hypothetical protein C8P64_3175 [Christiangramia gaetbulicola]|uniref:Uncharacterized protein n=1 Tax=Christiangramia gaetbulicola TaxID=703340 RepID=A0A2T6AD23_9FLAO|nr:hypothetical protein [Christiangramia gaetbulicola]PTX41676.1 hypothetical protein C8P64_3175 [Christiangramia gaetbulicola]
MEIFTDFIHNYNNTLRGLSIWGKILVTLALAMIFVAIIGAIVNVILLNV